MLAAADGARPGLEDRVFAATLPLIQAQPQPTLRLVGDGPAPRRRVLWSWTPMRIAASFGLVATAVLTYMAARPVPTTPEPGVRMVAAGEEWAIVSSIFDDGMSAELDAIFAATTSLESSIRSTGFSDLLEEGAM